MKKAKGGKKPVMCGVCGKSPQPKGSLLFCVRCGKAYGRWCDTSPSAGTILADIEWGAQRATRAQQAETRKWRQKALEIEDLCVKYIERFHVKARRVEALQAEVEALQAEVRNQVFVSKVVYDREVVERAQRAGEEHE